jgi:hypothetical protein
MTRPVFNKQLPTADKGAVYTDTNSQKPVYFSQFFSKAHISFMILRLLL